MLILSYKNVVSPYLMYGLALNNCLFLEIHNRHAHSCPIASTCRNINNFDQFAVCDFTHNTSAEVSGLARWTMGLRRFLVVALLLLAPIAAVATFGARCGCSDDIVPGATPLEDCCCELTDVDAINEKVGPLLDELADTTFFRYFRANIRRECPFWHENAQCVNRNCAIDEVRTRCLLRSVVDDGGPAG